MVENFFKIKRKNISFCDDSLVKIRRTSNSLNINYSQAFLRYIYCVMRFFLEKKIEKFSISIDRNNF